jgi:peptidoglycan/xylan/chitin deacetylase (PgdA/CDA1 family)
MNFKKKFFLANQVSSINSLFTNKINNSVLLYHSVKNINKKLHSDLDIIDVKSFTNQMLLLKKRYIDRVVEFDKNLLKKGNISISFDDGYTDNLEIVYPIIKKYQIPITIFICPSLIGTNGYLSISDLKFLAHQDLIRIGSHGFTHSKLKNLSNKFILNELNDSKKWLEDTLSLEITSMSFPHGSYDERVLSILKEKNIYKNAANSTFKTFKYNNIDNFMIPRIGIWYLDTIKSFENKINGSWDWIGYKVS